MLQGVQTCTWTVVWISWLVLGPELLPCFWLMFISPSAGPVVTTTLCGLAGLGAVGLYPVSMGTVPPHHGCPWPPSILALRELLACTVPWQWAQTFLSPELDTKDICPHGGPIAPVILKTPILYTELPLSHNVPNHFLLTERGYGGFPVRHG